jgi:hypothetical protein
MIVSGASRNGIEKCCLSVCAEPIEEEKGVLFNARYWVFDKSRSG